MTQQAFFISIKIITSVLACLCTASCFSSCINCHSCQFNNTPLAQCLQCLTSYYKRNTQNCSSCPINCQSCSSSSICTICSDGYSISSNVCTESGSSFDMSTVYWVAAAVSISIVPFIVAFFLDLRSKKQCCFREVDELPNNEQRNVCNQSLQQIRNIEVKPVPPARRIAPQEVCSICLEPRVYLQTSCLHCFHSKCLEEWWRKHGKCPMCRRIDLDPMRVYCPCRNIKRAITVREWHVTQAYLKSICEYCKIQP